MLPTNGWIDWICERVAGVGQTLLVWIVLGAEIARATTPVVQTYMVPMRDGVRLATDVYLPSSASRALPCILMRTPYGRQRYDQEVGSMARWGYAVAIQDLRGRFDSEGQATAFRSDGWGQQQDGYDTIDWLAAQDFCNGRIGTVGASAMGIAQTLLAPADPPNLLCQYILVAPSNLFSHVAYPGGALRLNLTETYLRSHAHPEELKEVLRHPRYDEYWIAGDATAVAGRVNVPAIHYGGWYDAFSQGTIDAFVSRQHQGATGARGRQHLVMGPWTHGGPAKTEFGDFALPPSARQVPLDISARRWFDHHLKAIQNGVDELPSVIYYVMGPFESDESSGNEWRYATDWPPAAESVSFYLDPQRTLTRRPGEAQGTVPFPYDPRDPAPTHGGRNLYLAAGPMDQRPLARREDVVAFDSPVLTHDLTVTGRMWATLYFSTNAADADVALRLCDVYPDGRSVLVAEGLQRLSSSVPSESRDLSGQIHRIDVDLWSTSLVFARGHRIQLLVSGANAPRWQPCPAGAPGGGFPSATHSIHVGPGSYSRLVLPVVSTVDSQ